MGSWLQSGSATAAEILADAGFAWLGLDCEHTSANVSTVEEIARALQGRATALLARVSESDPLEIRRCLDVGASGVIVPMVETVEQTRRAVSAAKYPPVGRRGYCFGRMNAWGRDFGSYSKRANRDTLVIVMIESRRGVENIREILAVPGLNAVFVGPYDLSGSYGVPGQLDHELVRQARERVRLACHQAGMAAGEHLVQSNAAQFRASVRLGYSLICLEADTIFLRAAAESALATVTSSE
jgi:2-keto-3-deoxy-L-rhamnonate aldolase RhmA